MGAALEVGSCRLWQHRLARRGVPAAVARLRTVNVGDRAIMDFCKVNDAVTLNSQSAWQRYLRVLDEARAHWLGSAWAKSDLECGRALFQVLTMEHVGFNLFVAPRHLSPYFSKDMFHHPMAATWGLCCPDFFYRHTFVDGAYTYRIKGRLGTHRWTEFHLQSEFWGHPQFRTIGVWDLADLDVRADGSFEIVLSPEPHEGNWIQLNPDEHNCMVVLRDALYDWTNDRPTAVEIDPVDPPADAPAHVAETDLDARLDRVGDFIRTSTKHWSGRNDQVVAEAGFNAFWEGRERALGGIQHARYLFMVYDIGPEEALVIETDVPRTSKYWSIQLADLCYQTLDYMDHQSSLNEHQALVDPDGKVRLVLSLEDPGVPNWLDAVGNPRGAAAWRWVRTDISPTPLVKKVALGDLKAHLHPETPHVTTAERRSVVAARRAAIRKLFDF